MAKNETTTDVEENARAVTRIAPRIDDADLRALQNWEDALVLSEQLYGEPPIDISQVYGTGFSVLKDKNELEDVPFIILSWQFNDGDYGPFASVSLVTHRDEKYVLNDGSQGIARQLLQITKDFQKTGGVMVSNGLRKSEYDCCANCGRPRSPSLSVCDTCNDTSERRQTGTTYYLAT